MDPRLVLALGQHAARVVAAVPLDHDRALRGRRPARSSARPRRRRRSNVEPVALRSLNAIRAVSRSHGSQTGEKTGCTPVPKIGLFWSFSPWVSANAAAVAASRATTSTVEAIRATAEDSSFRGAPAAAGLRSEIERAPHPYGGASVIAPARRASTGGGRDPRARCRHVGPWGCCAARGPARDRAHLGRRSCLPCLAYFELVQPRLGEGRSRTRGRPLATSSAPTS